MPKNDHYAIVVGISTYPDPSLKDLQGPVSDARAFCQWLRDPTGGDLDAQNIKCLLTTDFHPPDPTGPQDAHPIPNEIDVLFEQFVSGPSGADWRTVVYLCGRARFQRYSEC